MGLKDQASCSKQRCHGSKSAVLLLQQVKRHVIMQERKHWICVWQPVFQINFSYQQFWHASMKSMIQHPPWNREDLLGPTCSWVLMWCRSFCFEFSHLRLDHWALAGKRWTLALLALQVLHIENGPSRKQLSRTKEVQNAKETVYGNTSIWSLLRARLCHLSCSSMYLCLCSYKAWRWQTMFLHLYYSKKSAKDKCTFIFSSSALLPIQCW